MPRKYPPLEAKPWKCPLCFQYIDLGVTSITAHYQKHDVDKGWGNVGNQGYQNGWKTRRDATYKRYVEGQQVDD